MFFVKSGSILSEKSGEKSATNLLPVLATKFAALFPIAINSRSSHVSFI
jgi:hypothetical protein